MPIEPTVLSRIESPFFREAIREYVWCYSHHFRERLTAIYLWGSVFRNEAVPGVSDLDLHPIIAGEPNPEDETWRHQAAADLRQRFPECEGAVRPWSRDLAVQHLSTGRALPIRWRYDALLLCGDDLLAGLTIAPPDREWARLAIDVPLKLVLFTAGLEAEKPADFSLPDEEKLRLRKLARLGVLGGASMLMAQNAFTSYRGRDVLPALQMRYPQWTDFLNETHDLFIYPSDDASERLPRYLSRLVDWMTWVRDELD